MEVVQSERDTLIKWLLNGLSSGRGRTDSISDKVHGNTGKTCAKKECSEDKSLK